MNAEAAVATAVESDPVFEVAAPVAAKKPRKVRESFVRCNVKGCTARFSGPRRASKLGTHKYHNHTAPKAKVAVKRADPKDSVLAALYLKKESIEAVIKALESL